jgi:AcrR family transcriptional regulator
MEAINSVATSSSPTRARLLRAAERLFAEKGIANTSTRDILRAAGQRNESALQYHFGGREALIEALWADRGGQVNAEREALATEMKQSGGELAVRQLCEIALLPAVHLARRDPDFFEFLKVVGQVAFMPRERIQETYERYELGSVPALVESIRGSVDLPPRLLERRLELMSRFAMLALAQRAGANESFEGNDAELFVQSVLDAMAAMLSGPVSAATARALGESAARGAKGGRAGGKKKRKKRKKQQREKAVS